MDKENAIILFKEQEIRRTWYKGELSKELGKIATRLYFQPVTICHGLKYSTPNNDNYLSSHDEKKTIEEGVA